MWKRFLMAFMAFMAFMALTLATPAFATEAPEWVSTSHSRVLTHMERQAEAVQARIARELPALNRPTFRHLSRGKARQMDAEARQYRTGKALFNVARVMGFAGYGVAIVGFVAGIFNAIDDIVGGNDPSNSLTFAVGMVYVGGVITALGAGMGFAGWWMSAKGAAEVRPAGPKIVFGILQAVLAAASITLLFVPQYNGYTLLTWIASYVCAEIQNAQTSRYHNRKSAKRKGLALRHLQVRVAPTGLIGRF